MTDRIFLDSDVLLVLLLDRQPFCENISKVVSYAHKNKIALFTSPISITNINYIIEKFENKQSAKAKTQKLLQIIKVENVGQHIIDTAISSDFKDFEDAVQNYCAASANHSVLITRNIKDYKKSELAIFTPLEYLAKMK